MPLNDFKLNKPVGVDKENLDKVINDVYDAINRLAKLTNSEVSKLSKEEPSANQKIQVADDEDIKIKVQVGGEWYFTTALTKEE